MVSLKKIASDLDAEKEGRWFSDPWGAGLRFKVARFGNAQFNEHIKRLREEFLADVRDGEEIPDEDGQRIVREAFAHTVLMGWNVTDDETDEAIPYTPEAGISMLRDPEFGDLYDWLFEKSRKKAAYIKLLQEDGLKNSPAA